MRRLVTLILAVSLFALPSAAFAQSAGDEQYADPFDQTEEPSGSQGEPTQAPEPAPAPAPAPAQSDGTAEATQTQVVAQADTPTLPATGLPVGLLAGTGLLLLAGGTTLRRQTS
jgi:hypothetical protein